MASRRRRLGRPASASERYAALLGGSRRPTPGGVRAQVALPAEGVGARPVRRRRTGPRGDLVRRRLLAAPNVGVLGSHGAAALLLAATLLAWGQAGTAERIDRCMEIAARLCEPGEADDRLELCPDPRPASSSGAPWATSISMCSAAGCSAASSRSRSWTASAGCARCRPTRWPTRSSWWRRCCAPPPARRSGPTRWS